MGHTEEVMRGIERARAAAAARGEYVQPLMVEPREQWDDADLTRADCCGRPFDRCDCEAEPVCVMAARGRPMSECRGCAGCA